MADKLLDAAIKERDSIIAEIGKLALYQRLQRVEQVIKLLGSDSASATKDADDAIKPTRKTVTETKEVRILKLARECIRSNSGYAPMRTIHTHIQKNGIEVSDASLSAYLSRSPLFVYNAGRKAWQEKANETPSGMGDNETAVGSISSAAVNGASKHQHTLSHLIA